MLHRSDMFERFTDKARHVVVLAQEEARRLQHNYIGTEHILLGLLAEPRGFAFPALERFGMSLEGTREEVKAIIGTGNATVSGHIPFTPRAKKTLELALREALQLHHNYIGTEHILLGVIREGDGVGAQILKQHAELGQIRAAVIDLLAAVPATEATRGRRWLRRRSEAARRGTRAGRVAGTAHHAGRRHQPERGGPAGRISAGRLAPSAARRPRRRRYRRGPGPQRSRR